MKLNGIQARSIAVFLAMALAAGIALAARPTIRLADSRPKIDLEATIPKAFGDWKIDPHVVPIQVSPDVQENLDKIYDRTLSRTYVNAKGERVMLSLAYGAHQSRALQVHKPEVCYVAQGFQVRGITKRALSTDVGTIPVVQLVAQHGSRIEPITYWIRVGDRFAHGWLELNLARWRYGLTGRVPDGLLFRVSSISSDQAAAYSLQRQYIHDLLNAIPAASLGEVIGQVGE